MYTGRLYDGQHRDFSALKSVREGVEDKRGCGGEIHSDSAAVSNENGFKHGFLCILYTPLPR
jgi:hypothetical protein